jgi:hypothetical protein
MNTLTRICVIVVTIVAARTFGQEETDFRLDVLPAKPFAQGTKALQAWGSYTAPIRYSRDDLTSGSVGVGYYLWDNNCVTLVGHGFHSSNDADGGGVSVMGRTHLFTTDRWTFFIDGGGGYVWTDQAVPDGGTTYNFTARAGLGAGYRLDGDMWLTGGARYFHLSNGQQHGKEKNPGFDGVEYYVGVIWTWK